MARPKEFDPKEVLQIAIEVFWEKGYFDSSVDEVIKRSGVAKYGIYGTFGNKRELFMKTLTQYAKDRQQDIQRLLRKPDASLPEITLFFKEAPRLLTQKNSRRGCLISNTGIELGLRDPEIRNFVMEFFHNLTNVMKRCLQRAINKGQLMESLDVASIATYLVTEFRIALMLAASGYSRLEIKRHLDMALQVLH